MKRLPAFLLPLTAVAAPVPVELFRCADPNLEVTVWAVSPLLRNPTNIDIDAKGRIWVAVGVNYRQHFNRQPNGDRIMVLEDTDGDGKADKSWPFVQEPFLRAPLGVAVIGNKVVVSMAPDLVVYTDKDGDAVFDPAKGDTREVLLTGFNGRNHDHSLHSVTVGPDGKWHFSAGNCGAKFTDKSGKTFRIAAKQNVSWWPKDPERPDWDPNEIAGQKSDDGRVYVGGFIARMDPDGSNVEILAHNLRNSYENCVTSYGDIFASDNDDQSACRVFAVLEGGNYGFASADGQRTWQADRRPGQSIQTATWRQEDPSVAPAGDIYGGGAPTGCVFYENGALGEKHEGTLLVCESARNTIFGYKPQPDGAGWKLERFDFLTTNKAGDFAGTDFKGGNKGIKADDTKTLFRPSDIAVGPDGALYISDWHDPRTGGHATMDDALEGTIYRIAPKGFKSVVPKIDLTTVEGAIAALKSPAVHVRALARPVIQNAITQLDKNPSRKETIRIFGNMMPNDKDAGYAAARHLYFFWPVFGFGMVWKEEGKEDTPLPPFKDNLWSRFQIRMALRYGEPVMIIADGAERLKECPSWFAAAFARSFLENESYDLTTATLQKGKCGEKRLLYGRLADTKVIFERLDPNEAASGVIMRMFTERVSPRGFIDYWAAMHKKPALRWSASEALFAFQSKLPEMAGAFKERALSPALPLTARLEALTAIGFNDTKEAAAAMLEVAVKLNTAISPPQRGGTTKPGASEERAQPREPAPQTTEPQRGGPPHRHRPRPGDGAVVAAQPEGQHLEGARAECRAKGARAIRPGEDHPASRAAPGSGGGDLFDGGCCEAPRRCETRRGGGRALFSLSPDRRHGRGLRAGPHDFRPHANDGGAAAEHHRAGCGHRARIRRHAGGDERWYYNRGSRAQ